MNAFQPVEWEVFVVRIIVERPAGAWRGRVDHLPDRASAAFNTLEQLAVFMSRFVPAINPSPPAGIDEG